MYDVVYRPRTHSRTYADSLDCGGDETFVVGFFIEDAVDALLAVSVPLRVLSCLFGHGFEAIVDYLFDFVFNFLRNCTMLRLTIYPC